jgi:hypothetical protein
MTLVPCSDIGRVLVLVDPGARSESGGGGGGGGGHSPLLVKAYGRPPPGTAGFYRAPPASTYVHPHLQHQNQHGVPLHHLQHHHQREEPRAGAYTRPLFSST